MIGVQSKWTSELYDVVIEPNVNATLWELYRRSCEESHEILATLTGSYSDNRTAVISDVVHPVDGGPADVYRDHVTVTRLMAELWDRTSGGQFFLGEWHSHPRNLNEPSALDIDTAMSSARDGDGNCSEFIMVISGHDGISVHVVSAKGTVTKLQKSTEPSPIAKASEVRG